MGSDHNRIRRKWQHYGGNNATLAEASFYGCFDKVFVGTDFRIRAKPKEFQNIYVNVSLKDEDIKLIYTPINPVTRHGVFPDYAIDNTKKNNLH